jgi:hypothetical protein
MGPGNENSGRGQYFRDLTGKPGAISGLVLAPSLALLAGAYFGGLPAAVGAPLLTIAVILALLFWLADRKAEQLFWRHVQDSVGFTPFYDPTALETTTPLLHAGDRRFWKHEMMGPLGDSGLEARFALYRYDVRKENSKGEEEWDSHRFTICLVEGMEAGMQMFPGVYLRERRGLLSLGRHDWLRGRGLTDVELESTQFNETYELKITREQDELHLRQLFDPKTIVWLQEHPLRPQIEFRAGFLAVYVREHLDDLGRIVWLLEATERIAERIQAEVGESRTAATGG